MDQWKKLDPCASLTVSGFLSVRYAPGMALLHTVP
jgi:hypothetical protein